MRVISVCYDANVLDEIAQEMQIIIMRLQHWTLDFGVRADRHIGIVCLACRYVSQ